MNIINSFNTLRTATACACIALAASASAATVDFGEIEAGKTYSFSKGDEVKGTYTAPDDGSYKFVFTGHEVAVYPDQTYDQPIEHTFFYGDNSTRNWIVPLKEGQTVYLYSSAKSTISNGTMMLAAPPSSLELTSTSPSLEPGSPNYYGGTLSAAQYYRMTFFFNEQVTCTSASLRFPDGSYSPCATQISGSSIQVGFSSQIMDAYREGKLQKGDVATIRLVGVRCADYPDIRYGSNGRLEVEFTVDAKPAELVKMVNGPTTGMENFLSYYMPGDPNGIITMEFDADLADKNQHSSYARITYGNPEDLEHTVYTENLPMTIDGSTITIDLTGKLRRSVDMVPGVAPESQQKYIALRVGNIYSADGQSVFTGSMSSASAFNYAYNVQTVSYTFASDFTPATGTAINAGNPVEIWIMNGTRATFDSMKLSYTKGGAPAETILGKDEFETSADPDDADAVLVNFTMPDLGADPGTTVTVLPGNLFFADGMDHSADIIGEYYWEKGSGIEAVESAAKADVYSVTGVCVMRDATRADLRSLPAGIYIYGKEKIVR